MTIVRRPWPFCELVTRHQAMDRLSAMRTVTLPAGLEADQAEA